MSILDYRPDIDGLRAVAVVAVVAYHAHFPGISGGFVGVDVFFVISGFLVTSIILREIDRDQFSILNFYERRARRILPALFAMMLFVIVVAPLVLLPSEFSQLPSQMLGAVFFVANIVFWRQTDYFTDAADSNLLLHTWSLGVEEQFYILAPVGLILLSRFNVRLRNAAILLAVVISFVLCVYLTDRSPPAAFYLLPARAWELGLGALLAVGLVPKVANTGFREALASVGLALILGSVALLTPEMGFPGYAALAPVLGSALVIHSGEGTQVGRLLSTRLMVGIGLISYSLYLWHWPIFAAADLGRLPKGLATTVALTALATVAAWLSWRFVERPFRAAQRVSAAKLWVMSASTAAALAAVAMVFSSLQGWPGRLDPAALAYAAASDDISPRRVDCHVSEGAIAPEQRCFLGQSSDGQRDLVVWADSHGVELSYALSKLTRVHAITYSACPPAIGFQNPTRPQCAEHNEQVLRYLTAMEEPTRVVIASYYDEWIGARDFGEQLIATITAVEEAGHEVVVVGPTPGPGVDLPKSLARGDPATLDVSSDALNTPEVRRLLQNIEARTGAKVVRPSDRLCAETECSLLIDGQPTLFDRSHPSLRMAYKNAGLVMAAWDE